VNFAFAEEQLAFRDAVRDLLVAQCPPSVVRQAWEGPVDGGVVDSLLEMSEGTTALEQVLLHEETGRAAVPGPVVESTLFGTSRSALAFPEWPLVPWLTDESTVFAADPDGQVTRHEPGTYDAEPVATVDGSRHVGRVRFRGSGERVDGDGADVLDRAVLGTAAQLVGLAAAMIAMAVAYAIERRQFGVPIGSQQAVKHHLANAHLKVEYARPLVYAAAWSVAEQEPDRRVRVSMAKAYAGDAAYLASRTALQVHGAIGYAVEHDLHLFMKRSWALANQWGDARWHRERVAAAIL
jgi:hypothetical protein